MRPTLRHLVPVVVLAVLAGCGGGGSTTAATDPSVIVIESEQLVQVSDACHVQGTVLNTSDSKTFSVTLHWQAFDTAGSQLGATQIILTGVQPGERREYDATGIAGNRQGLVACSRIARFVRDTTTVSPS